MEEVQQEPILSSLDITDEMRIQFAIDEFYENMKGFDGEKITRVKLLRNNIINMMDTYLKKFNNQMIMKDFYKRLKEGKIKAGNNGRVNKYTQFMNEIRVVQEFKGIKENLAEKLSEQLFELFKKSEVVEYGETTADDTD